MKVFESYPMEGSEFASLPRALEGHPDAWRLGRAWVEASRQGGPTDVPTVEIITKEGRRRYARVDAMSTSSPIFVRVEAAQVLQRELGLAFVDVSATDGTRLQLLRVPVIPALDATASDVVWLEPGRATHMRRAVFRPETIGEHAAFGIPEDNRIYLTDRFLDVWSRHGFTGLTFKTRWES